MSSWETAGPVPRIFRIQLEGIIIESKTVNGIFSKALAQFIAKDERLPLNWEETVWRALKEAHPSHIHQNGKKPRAGVSVGSAMAFLAFMAKRIRNRSLVSIEEARRRAAICSMCPNGSKILGCSVCKAALKLTVNPPEAVSVPPGCSACGCFLPLKVWIPRDQLGTSDAFPFWRGCWMFEETE